MTQADLRSLLVAAGVPAAVWQLPDETYEPLSYARLAVIWSAWVDARPAALRMPRQIGGGKTIMVPRWLAQCGDCDNLALGLMMWADTGNALRAAESATMRGGLACGVLFYTAGPSRPENFNVVGGHAINWFVNLQGQVLFFEPGVGEAVDLNAMERSTAWFGLAA